MLKSELMALLAPLPEGEVTADAFNFDLKGVVTGAREVEGKVVLEVEVTEDYSDASRDAVDRLVGFAVQRGISPTKLMQLAGEDPDRLNNGGIREAVELLLEQDDEEWLEDLIEGCPTCCPDCGADLVPRMEENEANPDDKSLVEVMRCPNCG